MTDAAMTTPETFRDWIGKSETASDTLSPMPAIALAATLDRSAPAVGEPLLPGGLRRRLDRLTARRPAGWPR
jgi:3-methylfumaryl-CoA hydratase